MKPSRILLSLSLCLSLGLASPQFHPNGGYLQAKRDGESSQVSNSESASATPSAAATTQASDLKTITESSGSKTPSATGSNAKSGKETATTKPTAAPSNSLQNSNTTQGPLTSATSVSPNAPPGGISMISPAPTTTMYFKIGQNITFVWNYTSLLVPPSAIDILVSNTQSTYTLTQNASVQATGTYVWDTNQYSQGQSPLLNAFYTLAVFDAAVSETAIPSPGHLGAYGLNARFGIYATQTYTPLADFVCTTCSGALSDSERQTLKFLFGMVAITIFSFTYFSNGFLLRF